MNVNRSRIAKSTKQVVNAFSTSGFVPVDLSGQNQNTNDVLVASAGTLVANTLKNVMAETGKAGVLYICGVKNAEALSKTMRLQVIIDGVIVFDSTSLANSAIGKGFTAAGRINSAAMTVEDGMPIYWRSSAYVNVGSSTAGGSNLNYMIKYSTEAV